MRASAKISAGVPTSGRENRRIWGSGGPRVRSIAAWDCFISNLLPAFRLRMMKVSLRCVPAPPFYKSGAAAAHRPAQPEHGAGQAGQRAWRCSVFGGGRPPPQRPADAAGRQRSLRQPRRAERRAADYLPPGLPDGQAAGRALCRLGLHPAPGLSPQPPAPCRPWCWSGRKSGKRTNPGRLWQQTTAGRDLFLFCFSPPRSHRPGPC